MTRVIQSWDIRSTLDIRSNWGYRRTGSDMNELYDIPNPTKNICLKRSSISEKKKEEVEHEKEN